jgi:hypothetical protein
MSYIDVTLYTDGYGRLRDVRHLLQCILKATIEQQHNFIVGADVHY